MWVGARRRLRVRRSNSGSVSLTMLTEQRMNGEAALGTPDVRYKTRISPGQVCYRRHVAQGTHSPSREAVATTERKRSIFAPLFLSRTEPFCSIGETAWHPTREKEHDRRSRWLVACRHDWTSTSTCWLPHQTVLVIDRDALCTLKLCQFFRIDRRSSMRRLVAQRSRCIGVLLKKSSHLHTYHGIEPCLRRACSRSELHK